MLRDVAKRFQELVHNSSKFELVIKFLSSLGQYAKVETQHQADVVLKLPTIQHICNVIGQCMVHVIYKTGFKKTIHCNQADSIYQWKLTITAIFENKPSRCFLMVAIYQLYLLFSM